MTAEPDADMPMSPEDALGVLKRRTALLRDTVRILQRPSAVADEHAVSSALKVRKVALEAVENTQPIARLLVESLKRRAERVQELRDEFVRLRTLSDDVNVTPAEVGTEHRTANSLQGEHDDLVETLGVAHSATLAFE